MNSTHAARIGRTHHESQPWFESPPRAREGSPNIIYLILDDVGYSDLGCFGSEIRTPHFDRLAARGLRYSNFHTTTLCSSSRACLMTGRNHHSVGMRYLSNVDMGWPNGRGAVTRRAAMLAEVLRSQGYATFCVGKWHLAPTEQASAAGPFDQWPLGRGFERFYGFMNGSTDQFYPELISDNQPVSPPATPEEGYHLSADLVDRAIEMLANKISLLPEKPFFMNLAFGAGHFPHQVPPGWMDRYAGVYEQGWDELRHQRLARQKAIGLVPQDTDMPASNPGVAAWSQLSLDEQRVSVRLQQAYAAFLEYTDAQFGRLLDFLDDTAQLDNTLIVLVSDNGASVDCGPRGTTNVLRWFNHIEDSTETNLAEIDLVGTPRGFSNYPWGWSQLSNTPLKLYKSFVHGGGVRDPMVVCWPAGFKAAGELRHQFVHAVDVMPTVLDVCGITAPVHFCGVPQMPVHGHSFRYSFHDASAPTRKEVQYFEMYGHRSLWHKGWKAVTNHVPGTSFEEDEWELYHLDRDFSEAHDLAAAHPARLREMIERWWAEAGKYDVMPLDDRREILFKPDPKPGSIRGRNRYVYLNGIASIPAESAPLTSDVSHCITVELEHGNGDSGTLVCFGNVAGGYALYVQGDQLVYLYSRCGEITRLVAGKALRAGMQMVAFEFVRSGPLQGEARLRVDGQVCATVFIPAMLQRTSLYPLQVGRPGLPPICADSACGQPYGGRIVRITFDVGTDRGDLLPSADVD